MQLLLRPPIVMRFRHVWSYELAFFLVALFRASLVSVYLLVSVIYPNFPQHRFAKILQAPAVVLSLPPVGIGHLSSCLRSPAFFDPIRPGCDAVLDPRGLLRRHLWTTALAWLLTIYGLRIAVRGVKNGLRALA